jgi:aspartate aminotransferase
MEADGKLFVDLNTSFRTPPLSRAVTRFPAEGLVAFMVRAQQLEAAGRDVVHCEIGEPDFATPAPITQAAIDALQAGRTHYTPVAGTDELRAAVAADASRFRHLSPAYTAENVIVGPGAKPLLWNLFGALLDPGDDVVFASPAYSVYAAAAAYIGARAVTVPLREASGWRIDHDALADAVSARTKVIVLNSPSNPTGGVLDRADLEAIAAAAERVNAYVIADEIYSRQVYDGTFESIAGLAGMRDRTIVVDGFSKAYAMTGWRLGYALAPREIVRTLTFFANNTYQCVPAFTQDAGVAALATGDEHVVAMCDELRRHRDAIVAGLNALPGVTCCLPGGAFYAFPNISAVAADDLDFARFLLEDAAVATLPGSTFGADGRGHLRLSYATSLDRLTEALARMRGAIARYPG